MPLVGTDRNGCRQKVLNWAAHSPSAQISGLAPLLAISPNSWGAAPALISGAAATIAARLRIWWIRMANLLSAADTNRRAAILACSLGREAAPARWPGRKARDSCSSMKHPIRRRIGQLLISVPKGSVALDA